MVVYSVFFLTHCLKLPTLVQRMPWTVDVPHWFSGHLDKSQGQTADTNVVRSISWPSRFEAAKLNTVIVLRVKMYPFDFQVNWNLYMSWSTRFFHCLGDARTSRIPWQRAYAPASDNHINPKESWLTEILCQLSNENISYWYIYLKCKDRQTYL